MGKLTVRTSCTSRGAHGLSPYSGNYNTYEISNINLGYNPLSKIEVVSALNSFNITQYLYHINYANSTSKYNPKVYLGTIQSVSNWWNYDAQTGQNNGLPNMVPGQEKSGSWPQIYLKNLTV